MSINPTLSSSYRLWTQPSFLLRTVCKPNPLFFIPRIACKSNLLFFPRQARLGSGSASTSTGPWSAGRRAGWRPSGGVTEAPPSSGSPGARASTRAPTRPSPGGSARTARQWRTRRMSGEWMRRFRRILKREDRIRNRNYVIGMLEEWRRVIRRILKRERG